MHKNMRGSPLPVVKRLISMSFVSDSHWSPEPGWKLLTLPHNEVTWQSKYRLHLGRTYWLILSTVPLPALRSGLDISPPSHPPLVQPRLFSHTFREVNNSVSGWRLNCSSTWSSITLNKNICYKISTTSTSISQIFFCQDGSHVLWSEITLQ